VPPLSCLDVRAVWRPPSARQMCRWTSIDRAPCALLPRASRFPPWCPLRGRALPRLRDTHEHALRAHVGPGPRCVLCRGGVGTIALSAPRHCSSVFCVQASWLATACLLRAHLYVCDIALWRRRDTQIVASVCEAVHCGGEGWLCDTRTNAMMDWASCTRKNTSGQRSSLHQWWLFRRPCSVAIRQFTALSHASSSSLRSSPLTSSPSSLTFPLPPLAPQ
jgi:hypothetical protein